MLLAIALICLGAEKLSKQESDDEMSIIHMKAAKAAALDFSIIVFMIAILIYLVCELCDIELIKISAATAFKLTFGIIYASIGFFFAKYEKDGE